ncbi:hypothetical protein Ahy_B01g056485 isoform A [Arachis hypogaea]|uniref:Uncharacterized protein n=1 Tax=Arachis hypogaea TaxID=3818 RepID=A0A445AYZ1_ARAHY|nr:hypothetical protein Ahy_B01g056485 isoform A [Arachis hypogaea]
MRIKEKEEVERTFQYSVAEKALDARERSAWERPCPPSSTISSSPSSYSPSSISDLNSAESARSIATLTCQIRFRFNPVEQWSLWTSSANRRKMLRFLKQQ